MKFHYPSTHLELEFPSSINSIVMIPISQTRYQLVSAKPEWLGLLGYRAVHQQFKIKQPEEFLENFLLKARNWLSNIQYTCPKDMELH